MDMEGGASRLRDIARRRPQDDEPPSEPSEERAYIRRYLDEGIIS